MNFSQREALNLNMIELADGDRNAFDPIFEMTKPIVFNFASRLINNKEEADDVAQNALMKVFSRAHEFRKDGDALSWILGITAFECKTYRKKLQRRREDFNSESIANEIADEKENTEDLIIKKDLERALHVILEGLNPGDKETLLISILEQSRPDVSPATFRKRLERAMTRLKDQWRDHHE